MFEPPRCPNAACAMHSAPEPRFFTRQGFYRPKCRAVPVPRFCCRHCRRGFSRQTFRVDYRDHKPHLNARLFWLLASGVGLRHSARNLQLSRHCAELKFRKIARAAGQLHDNLLDPFRGGCELEMDELVTFESSRLVRPLTLPILIEARSLFVIAARSAPIRPSGKKSPKRAAAIARDEKRCGRRFDESKACVSRVLASGARCCKELALVVLRTDQKELYVPLAKQAFGERRLVHLRSSSKLPRTPANPIFRINFTAALARDLNGRLRRRSWLASKKRSFLDLQLGLFMTYRNYIRRRVNRRPGTAAMKLGLMERALTPDEALGWRQDWGERSIHPTSDGRRSIGEVKAARRGAVA